MASGDPISGIDEQYMIVANTFNTYNGCLDQIKTPYEIRKYAITEIADLNLGIEKRKKVDLSLVKDIDSVKVSINHQSHLYKYADRFNANLYASDYKDDNNYDNQEKKNQYNLNPQVKFGSKYGNMSYTRALYASDIRFGGEDKLKVEVIYKIGIQNTASDLKVQINELTDYYDSKYNFKRIGTQIDEEGNVKETDMEVTIPREKNGYQEIKIKPNLEVSDQEGIIYVQLEVKSDKIIDIVSTSDNDELVKLDNIIEISSYSVKDEKGENPYAAIDVDSQPGNFEKDKQNEDDNDKAPGLKIVLQEERKISGTVFEDVTEGDLQSGKIRQGDGKLTAGDKGIGGVTVELQDKDGKQVEVYDQKEDKWVPAETITDETDEHKGEYTISGMIPGEYKLVYKWGNKEYKVQDYKGTIVDESTFKAKNENSEWYKEEFKKNYPTVEWDQGENTEIRVSDAIDDYNTRKTIDEQTKLITNGNKEVIDNYEGQITKDDENSDELITQMNSTTPDFKVNVEYDTAATDASEEYELNDNGEIVMNGIYAIKKEGKRNYLRSIDFGIVERARQVLSLDKRVKSAKITLANGNVLINAKVVKDKETGKMKFEDDIKHAVYLPSTDGTNGQVKFEIDNEIIQGAKLEVEYSLQVSNISEVEYLNEDYYFYGEEHGQKEEDLVTLSADQVIDYLDNNITVDIQGNEIGEIIEDSEKKKQLISDNLLMDTQGMKDLLGNTNKIMLVNKLNKSLKPTGDDTQTGIEEISLKAYKLLSSVTTATEETTFENDAEIIKVKKTGGSSLITTPGNYVPSLTDSEYDDDKGETILILPPTGLSTDYISYTILAISSLGILVAGILLIKKFILRK